MLNTKRPSLRQGLVALSSALLCQYASSAPAPLVPAFSDPLWPQQEPSLGTSKPWSIDLPGAYAAKGTCRGFCDYYRTVFILAAGVAEYSSSDIEGQSSGYRVDWFGLVTDDSSRTIGPNAWGSNNGRFGLASLSVLGSTPDNGIDLAGIAPVTGYAVVRYQESFEPLRAPTKYEVMGTLGKAQSLNKPIVLVAVDPQVANGAPSACPADLQASIDSAKNNGTLLFADSRNALLANCNGVMHIGPLGDNVAARPNPKSQLTAPDATFAKDVDAASGFGTFSGSAPVVAAGVAALVRGILAGGDDELPAEALRGAMRAATTLCPTCESGRGPLNANRTVQGAAQARLASISEVEPNDSLATATKPVIRGGFGVTTGGFEHAGEVDWFYVKVPAGRELSVALGNQWFGGGSTRMEAYRGDAFGGVLEPTLVVGVGPSINPQMVVPATSAGPLLPKNSDVWIKLVNTDTGGSWQYTLYTIAH